MPKRKHIALVACEACRKRKSRCDGNSPVCAPCQTKRTRCAYPSEPNVSRFASLKSDYEHLKLNHAKLSAIYDRLKNGSASEATRLLECIRKEDEIPSLSGTKDSPPRPFNDHQPTDHDEKPAEEIEWRRPVSSAWSGGQTSLELEPASDLCAMPHGIGPADTIFNVESEKQSSFSLSPRALLRNSKFDGVQTSENIQQGPRPHISVSHKVLLWPRIVSHLTQSGHAAAAGPDLQYLVRHGSPWLLQRETSKHRSELPCNVGLPSSTLRDGTVFFPGLTIRRVNEYSSAYFNTFNMLLPLLDLDLFMDSIVTRVLREGYRNDDLESVVALLVFALGQLAIEGVTGRPAGGSKDEASGFRGGTIEKPPGLGLFNEARRRIGMINMQPCLENVQILLLQAIYFESSARHTSFWSSISAASLACTCLIRSEQIDWTSVYGDLVKRAFWVCVLQERLFHLEFRVISTGIESLEDDIPLPHFQGAVRRERLPSGPLSDAPRDVAADKPEHFHFVAMITLSRLIRRANNMIHGYEPGLGENEPLWQGSDMPTLADASTYLLPAEGYEGPPSAVVSELFRQLECWRDALPQWLQWRDDDRFDFGGIQPLGTALHASFFSPLRNLGPGQLDHNVDVAVAQLRTRFYHARFLICRPFIYKALHFPDLMTADDRIKCAFAIDAACLWPLSLAPPKNKKHLIPQLFSWTQNFLAMILVLRTSRSSKYLDHICKENSIMEANIESAIDSMIKWLEDVRQVDGIADWSLRVLGPSFS